MVEIETLSYLIAIVSGWVIAHIIKYALDVAKRPPQTKREKIFRSGGMPSAHVMTAAALWMVILLKDGLTSGLFGMMSLFILIVAHDAVRVRRSSGEQGAALNALIDESKSKIPHPIVAKGHTVLEVVVGWALGIVVGLVVFYVFNA
jgi:acid phosphatase family membrane protein YuiD